MGRLQNDGRGRLGGRAKGTKNKPKQPLQAWILDTLYKHRGQVEEFLASSNPNDKHLRVEVLKTLALAAAVFGNDADPAEATDAS